MQPAASDLTIKVAQEVRIKAEVEWKERMEQESIRVAAETVQLEVKLKAEAVALAATFKADTDKLKELQLEVELILLA